MSLDRESKGQTDDRGGKDEDHGIADRMSDLGDRTRERLITTLPTSGSS